MRILLAPSNVANQSTSLARGLRERGHHAEIWNYGESPNGFEVDRLFNVGAEFRPYFEVFREALASDFDVVHFQTARSLIPARAGVPQMWDLPVWRAMGKQIVFSFHGSDVRLASHHRDDDPWSFYRFADIPCDEEKIAGRLEIIRTYAHHLTVSSVLDRIYVPDATYLPKSIVLDNYPMVGGRDTARPRVLHPTRRRATKGTDMIERLLGELQREVNFDFKILEGASHAELVQEMKASDVVVEKLLGGDAGVTSLEAMALGKVAVARIRDEVLSEHPRLPVINANPETFKEVMKGILSSARERKEVGERGRRYVSEYHSAARSGSLAESMYSSRKASAVATHPHWIADPSALRLASIHR